MGQGGKVVIVNGTEHPLQGSNFYSYQMSWEFDRHQTIAPFSFVEVYVEFYEGIFDTKSDDSANATYSVPDGHLSFLIHASFRDITVTTTVNGQIYRDNLGWNHDGKMVFVIAGQAPNYFINNSVSTESWMSQLLPLFGNRCLRDITVPGSHDAGMSEIDSPTAGSNAYNTQTQAVSIYDQLMRGSRYFDIRPIIGGGEYLTGHYSNIEKLGVTTNQGARGQSIDAIIQNINNFTATHNELVILTLSHDSNTDLGNASYRSFTKAEYQRLLELLSSQLKHLFVATADAVKGEVDVTLIPLNQLIDRHPSVIVFVDTSDDFLGKGTSNDYTKRGFYPLRGSIEDRVQNNGVMKTLPPTAMIPSKPPAVSIYDHYTGTEDVESMINDQLSKMENFSFSGNDCLFLLSWTLTLSDGNSVADALIGNIVSIKDIAAIANQRVYEILPKVASGHRPNIVYLDFYSYNSFTAFVVAINLKVLKG